MAFRPVFRAMSLACLVAAFSAIAPHSRAAEIKSSLELVPADAQVYVSVSRLGEHLETIAKSNWWAKAQANAALQDIWKQITGPAAGEHDHVEEGIEGHDDDHGHAGPPDLAALLADPQNLELLLLAREMTAEEMFFFCDKRPVELQGLFADVMRDAVITQFSIMMMLFSGGFDDFERAGAIAMELMLEPIREQLDKIAVPYAVVGFKVKDPVKVERLLAGQVERLKKLVEGAGLPAPSNTIEETTAGGQKCWILPFDGASVPWSAAFAGELPPEYQSHFDPIIEHLQKQKGYLVLSVQHGYVLLAITDTPDRLAELGQGSLLANQPDFAPLKNHAAASVTGLVYASRQAAAGGQLDKSDLVGFATSVKRALRLTEVNDTTAKAVGEHVDEMAQEIGAILPEPGAQLSVAVTSREGLEFFTYDHSQPLYRDGGKPLSILDHVGPAPLAFWAGRTKGVEESYATTSKWIGRTYALAEKHLLAIDGGPFGIEFGLGEFKQVFARLVPLAKRADRAIKDLWLPPLSEGQAALVLDARVANSLWFGQTFPKEFALPLPAVVFGCKDTDQLHAGIKEFRSIVNDGAASFAEVDPEIGAFKLADPRSREFPEGTIYWHVLPKEWGVDKRIAPNYGFGEKFAAFSFVPLHTQALLGRSELKLPSPLDRRDVPLAAAAHVDVPRLIEAIWGVSLAANSARFDQHEHDHGHDDAAPQAVPLFARQDPPNDEEANKKAEEALRGLMELAKAVPSYTSATRVEEGVTIKHSILRIKDLPGSSK